MVNELNKVLLKKIATYDLGLCLIFITVGYIFYGISAMFFFLGIFFAYVNLSINSLVTSYLLTKCNPGKRMFILFGTLFRTLLVSITGIIIITKSDLNFIIYIIGYTSQLISMVLYGLNLKSSERK
ncbi:hypothetical protein [Clostridium tunisiense]|uniref:hypothetical protein n=1 Tax=Clostridium tunisiense TaxID=219748 RepID=UPI0002D54643|nr:hypothetical protein [Clostridium tunisiense]